MAAGEKPEWTVARRAGPDTEGRPSATAARPICAGSWRSKGPRPATGGRPSRHSAAAAQTRPAPAPTAPARSTAPPIPWPCGQRSPCGTATSRWRSDSGGRSDHKVSLRPTWCRWKRNGGSRRRRPPRKRGSCRADPTPGPEFAAHLVAARVTCMGGSAPRGTGPWTGAAAKPKFPKPDKFQLIDQGSIFQFSGVPGTGNVSMRCAARR